ncbi:MAG: tetratricopeptide repeat protein, partial [Parachlamydiaceae bacterium]
MKLIDKHYLRLQFWNKVYQKNATEFQSFFEDIMQKAFPDFQKTRPYGNQGDRGNDGYRPDKGIYYQAYSPQKPLEKEADTVKKLKKDFETLKAYWNQISKIKTFYFVFNDKGLGVSIEIERALAELRDANPHITFKKLLAKDLEDIFFTLKPDQFLALEFDIDSRNALRIARESLAKLEIDLDRDNGIFVLRSLENHKDIISSLEDEDALVEYEILECLALQKLERVKEAKQKYENLCKRHPNDPRAFLYLAEIYLNNDDFDKNEEAIREAERINSSHWLLRLEKLIREHRLGIQIDLKQIEENNFPTESRIRSRFYRLYAAFLLLAGDQARAESLIERAMHLNPQGINNYITKLSISQGHIFSQTDDKQKLQKNAEDFLSEIEALQEKANEWGGLGPRNQAILTLQKLDVLRVLENVPEVERLAKESFELIMQCYFDYLIDNLLVGLLMFVELPPKDLERLVQYFQGAEKVISDGLSKMIVIQFTLKTTLFTEGRKFFETSRKKGILEFIDNLEKKEYDKAQILLKEDLRFAVAMANVGKQFPDLRKKIIENLPDDGNIQKEKLLLLLNYDEKNINEA